MAVQHYRTRSVKKKEYQPEWLLVDASGEIVGRLASALAKRLQGKHNPWYTAHINCGARIIVINADKIRFTGKKEANKCYSSYTGYPGGQRSTSPAKLREKGQVNRILRHAVKGMLPKSRLSRNEFMKNLYIYSGEEHSHEGQSPKKIKIT